MKVVAYLAGIPPKNKNLDKPEVLSRFINGVAASGDTGILHTGNNIVPCEVAFIQGWSHEHGKSAPHLQLREAVRSQQKQNNNRLLIVDSNLFNYTGRNSYARFSFDGVFPTTGNYFWDNPDPARWQQISRDTGISLKPWQTNGKHILICTQRNGGWSMKGLTVVDWLNQTVTEIRKHTDRPIVVRPHPGDKRAQDYLNFRSPHWKLSGSSSLTEDLSKAWATITYNSSPGVASTIEGVPAFVTDPNPQTSQAFSVANTDLSKIETPATFDRQAWIERIAMCHWNYDELSNGAAWRHMKQFV